MKPVKSSDLAWLLVIALIIGPVVINVITNITHDKQEIRRL